MKCSLPVRLSLPAVLLAGMSCGMPAFAAQGPPAAATLVQKAQALERSGRGDSASLIWQQVLLLDPENGEAQAGLARAAKLSGGSHDPAKSNSERARVIQPNDAHLDRGEAMGPQKLQDLDHAAQFAAQGQYTQAMNVYRAVLGTTPPPGNLALAYYETEAALDGGRPHAVAGLRGLAAKYPGDARYQIALGRILTFEPKTRSEGRRLLERYPQDTKAVEALRQSLVWDAGNPASAADLRAYLIRHSDPQLAQALQEDRVPAQEVAQPHPVIKSRIARLSSGHPTADQSPYRAPASGSPGEAERRFRAVLAQHPQNGAALAGMGYLQMRLGNFSGAISFLVHAQQVGVEDAALAKALDTARFRYALSEAQAALARNDLTTARTQFQAAAILRPESQEALEGLGRMLLRKRQPDAAATWFERLTRAQPNSPAAWMWLMEAQEQLGHGEEFLRTERSIPSGAREKLMLEPEFLNVLVSAYFAAGREAEAQQTLQAALDLPFPPGGQGVEPEKQLQYANLLQQAKRFDQADGLYRQVLAVDGANPVAWKGLLEAEHSAGRKEQALATLAGMPASVYTSAMREPGFDVAVSAILMAHGQTDKAEEVLDRSVAQKSEEEAWVSLGARLQLARIYLAHGRPELAYTQAQKALAGQPDAVDAWEILLASLHASGRDQEAFMLVEQLSPAVRTHLEGKVDSVATMAAVYRALGQTAQASALLARLRTLDLTQHITPPIEAEIEDARMLLNEGDEIGLYRQLVFLDARADTTGEQRRVVQTLWAAWAVRRANQSATVADRQRAVALLDTAANSFPDNRAALLAIAGAYTQAGQPRRAVALYKRTGLTNATAEDYAGALSAALAANDLGMAESWLREALAANPHDAPVLLLAAKVEQARGAPERAAEFYRASLAAAAPVEEAADGGTERNKRVDHPIEPVGLAVLLAPTDSVTAPKASPHLDLPLGRESRTSRRETMPRLRNYVPVYVPPGAADRKAEASPSLPVRVP